MLVTPKKTGVVVAAIWCVSGFVASMKLWLSFVLYPSLALIIVVCLFCSFVAYFKVYRIVRRHQAQIQSQLQVQASANIETQRRWTWLRRSAVNTFYVYCLFMFCYIPYLSILIVGLVIPHGLSKGYAVTTTFVNLNSALNPLLYCWRLSEIRRAVKQIFGL